MKLKTRTNQPVYYKLPVSSNMEQLSDGMLNSLKVGDVVQKKTGEQKHCYIVTYKEEKHGICLTYVDAGYMETISYDYTNSHWVFNSKDVVEVPSSQDIQEMLVGKYVRIMPAPEGSASGISYEFTAEEKADVIQGIFINGTFLGMNNPIITPARLQGDNSYAGYILYSSQSSGATSGFSIRGYTFSANSTIFTIKKEMFRISAYPTQTPNILFGYPYPVAASQNNVNSGDVIVYNSALDVGLNQHLEVEINGHRCRFESEETSGNSTYIIYSSFGEVSATGKLTANIISYNKSTREISFNQMTFTPDA